MLREGVGRAAGAVEIAVMSLPGRYAQPVTQAATGIGPSGAPEGRPSRPSAGRPSGMTPILTTPPSPNGADVKVCTVAPEGLYGAAGAPFFSARPLAVGLPPALDGEVYIPSGGGVHTLGRQPSTRGRVT